MESNQKRKEAAAVGVFGVRSSQAFVQRRERSGLGVSSYFPHKVLFATWRMLADEHLLYLLR
jgi:hypothetical protein